MIKRQFTTLPGTKQWGFINLPSDRTKKYPLVFFCHGSGEYGNTEASADKLLVHGPLRFPSEDRIIVAIQHHSWSFPEDRIVYVLANDPDIKAHWNGVAMITGLSAGGEIVINFMRKFHNPNYIYIPMSPSGTAWGLTAPAYKVWGFVGNADKTTGGALQTLSNIKATYGGRLTIYSGGHGGWNAFYDPAYKEEGKNIYDWAFGSEVIVVPPVEPVPVTITKVVVHYSDNSTKEL